MEDPSRPVTGYPAPNLYLHPNGYPPAGTAYPCTTTAAGPPYNYYQYNPYYQQSSEHDAIRRAACVRRMFAFFIGVIFFFGTVTFITWLVLRPQLPEFRVDSFSVSNFTLTDSSLVSFTSEIHLTVRNPNKKMTLSYDEIRAIIFYKSTSLSENTMAPFSQHTKTDSALTANFVAIERSVDESAAHRINTGRLKNGNVGFNFRLVSRIQFEAKAWRTTRSLMVYCGDFSVSIPSNGSSGMLTSGPSQCRVGI
ncbi:NDR1/HIN1-like protein 26 [Henckelia pumila]|uniref:NDR1/HIN1-like protein 26 n=1 Tax=Henckelia pumila TaxID=405737 RepID=UPI003C6E4483